jgi:hypothetical protein
MNTPENTPSSPTPPPQCCAHPGCRCTVQPGQKYCCEACEGITDTTPCTCGHAECEKYTENSP